MCLIWYNQNLGLNLTPIQLHMKSFSTPWLTIIYGLS
jgi:hypothetical protein